MKTRTIEYDGSTFIVTGKGQIRHEGGRCNVYEIRCGTEAHEDLIMPTGRSISDHLTRIGGPRPRASFAETSVQTPKTAPSNLVEPVHAERQPTSVPRQDAVVPLAAENPVVPRASRESSEAARGVGAGKDLSLAKKQPRQSRRGRPPKGTTTMTGAERQRALQARRRKAEQAQRQALEHVRCLRGWAEATTTAAAEPAPSPQTREFQEFKSRVIKEFNYLERLLSS